MSNRKIKIGVAGLNFGQKVIESEIISGPGAEHLELSAIADLEYRKADRLASVYGIKSHKSLETMLQDKTIEAIALFTPPIERASLISKIIRAGKHVITTKPFERDPDTVEPLFAEAKRLKKVIHLNSPAPYLPKDLEQIKIWQHDYNLGMPIGAHFQTWCNYREYADGSWYDNAIDCPVAPLFRLGIYAINDLLWFFSDPQQVQVATSRIFTGRPTPDNALVSIKFANGGLASLYASFCIDDAILYSDTLVINFERGTVYRNAEPDIDDRWSPVKLRITTKDNSDKIENSIIIPREKCSGNYMWKEFKDAVLNYSEDSILKPKQIADGLRIIEAAARAEKTGEAELFYQKNTNRVSTP